MTVLHPNAAGIDVHSDMHMVCVPADRVPPAPTGDPPAHVRRFGANSCDLAAMAEWLRRCGVTTVEMGSTGVYWIPLFELLESRGFEVWLVEPGQLSRCGARPKTDVLDAQWIQRLHSYGCSARRFVRPSRSWRCGVTTANGRWPSVRSSVFPPVNHTHQPHLPSK